MYRFAKPLALLILAGLLGIQLHIALEQLSTLGEPLMVQHSSAQDFEHQAGQHFCAVCMAGIWATLSALPQLGFASATSLRRTELPAICGPTSFSEVSSPRAPPLA